MPSAFLDIGSLKRLEKCTSFLPPFIADTGVILYILISFMAINTVIITNIATSEIIVSNKAGLLSGYRPITGLIILFMAAIHGLL